MLALQGRELPTGRCLAASITVLANILVAACSALALSLRYGGWKEGSSREVFVAALTEIAQASVTLHLHEGSLHRGKEGKMKGESLGFVRSSYRSKISFTVKVE